jgi:hypothetical protein
MVQGGDGLPPILPGYTIGVEEPDGKFYINNHLHFTILYHKTHGEYMRARSGYSRAAVLENIDARRLLLTREQMRAMGAPLDVPADEGRRALQADAGDD